MANGYKKIASTAASGRLATTTMSLWQGEDHLLQVERVAVGESRRESPALVELQPEHALVLHLQEHDA